MLKHLPALQMTAGRHFDAICIATFTTVIA